MDFCVFYVSIYSTTTGAPCVLCKHAILCDTDCTGSSTRGRRQHRMMRRKLLYRRDFCGIIVWRFEVPPRSRGPTRAGGCLLPSIVERCCGDEPYFNCRKSLGAAHWVAQCWRWKTVPSRVSDSLVTPLITQNLMASLISLVLVRRVEKYSERVDLGRW